MKNKHYSKELILEKAITLAREVGFKKLTMRDLAKSIGCSVMPIYSTFDSKEMLIEEIYNKVVRELISIKGYFKRNNEVLKHGITSPAFYRDMRDYNTSTINVEELYSDTISLMQAEEKLKDFDESACSNIHFDISVYISGIVERQLNKRRHFDNYEQFCINTLHQFTETLIMGYRQVVELEK